MAASTTEQIRATPAPRGAEGSSSVSAASSNALQRPPQTKPKRWRFTKRFYVWFLLGLALLVYAVQEEGMGGLVTMAAGLVGVRLLWWLAASLVLNRFPMFRTMCNTLFQWTDSGEAAPPQGRRVIFE